MVKILSLIGTIFTGIGLALQLLVLGIGFTITQYFEAGSFIYMSTYGLSVILISHIAIYLGMILIFFSGFFKGNVMLIISGILCILGSIAQLMGFLTYSGFQYYIYTITSFTLGGFVLTLGMLLYFIGLIGFRKKNKVAWIFGFLLFAIVATSNIFAAFLNMLIQNTVSDGLIQGHLISYIAQAGVFVLYGFVFFFSKTKVGWESDKVEDTMSVSSGSAFTSYVPDETKEKKKKSKKSDEDFSFNF